MVLPDRFDVLVVGGGAAGLYAALCLPKTYRVGLITKDTLSLSASDWAQGGIAAAIAPDDSSQLHIEDTLKAGAGLCEPDAVQFLVNQASDCIQSLVEMGVAFDRHGADLALTLEAAHRRRRVLHAADTTGRAVVTTLVKQVLSRDNIQILSQAFAIDLWLHPETQRCQGISLVYENSLRWIQAKAIVLATGGGGQVFSQTTNPTLSTGDGVAIAWRSGAILRDLEFFQFHPTALTKPGAPHFLISEAVRGEGAHLIDRQGHRFTFDYHPAGELAPRDIVSRAIYSHLQQSNSSDSHVWLDLRPIAPETIQRRFPNIIEVCQRWDINIFQEPIPVAPAAHYWMGGVSTDLSSRTSISGLYAIGETASTGVHGANRLASNSLLECIVFGGELAKLVLPTEFSADFKRSAISDLTQPTQLQKALDAQSLDDLLRWQQQLQQLLWQSAGICRTQVTMQAAVQQVEVWQATFAKLPLSQAIAALNPGQDQRAGISLEPLRRWGELRNLLSISELILKSALFRTESRGGHYRDDYPFTANEWEIHTLIQGESVFKSHRIDHES